MSGRPRIIVFDATDRKLSFLDETVDWVRVETPQQVMQVLADKPCDGVLIPTAQSADIPLPTSLEVLERLKDGIAIVRHDFTLVWTNQAFKRLCETDPAPGVGIYQALRCEEIEGPDFCPFTNCATEGRDASTVVRIPGNRRYEIRVQPLADTDPTAQRYMLCSIRDVTNEISEREKLIAIHRAGLELSHLTPQELAQMSVAERLDLLKANILQYSQSILQFKNFEIRCLDKRTNRLTVLLSEGMITDATDRELVADADGNGVTGFVAATGTSYVCHDVEHDPLYIPGACDARSSMTVPIIYREEVVGTFNVESPKPSNFGERDQEFLEIFAREIAVALNTLDLLQAEKKFSGKATVEAIVEEVSLPVDDIIADSLRVLEQLESGSGENQPSVDAVKRVLKNARMVKSAIHQVRREYETQPLPSEADRPTWLSGRRVLVADNDSAIRRSAHWLLGRAGCEVDTAKDGQEALTMARTIKYDVVLGDIRLPDMNGYEFYCLMRERLPGTPVVLMTGFGYDSTHSLVKARQDGLKVVLYKPFRFDRLCEAIEDALDPQNALNRTPSLARTKKIVL